jgi:hypothetical protein
LKAPQKVHLAAKPGFRFAQLAYGAFDCAVRFGDFLRGRHYCQFSNAQLPEHHLYLDEPSIFMIHSMSTFRITKLAPGLPNFHVHHLRGFSSQPHHGQVSL